MCCEVTDISTQLVQAKSLFSSWWFSLLTFAPTILAKVQKLSWKQTLLFSEHQFPSPSMKTSFLYLPFLLSSAFPSFGKSLPVSRFISIFSSHGVEGVVPLEACHMEQSNDDHLLYLSFHRKMVAWVSPSPPGKQLVLQTASPTDVQLVLLG